MATNENNNDQFVLDQNTPLELATNVHGLLAVKKDGSSGAVGLETIANEAGKKVGEAVKITGNILPTLGDANKIADVLGGTNGKVLTYNGTPFNISANHNAKLFWDGILKTWEIIDDVAIPFQTGVATLNPTSSELPQSKAVALYVTANAPTMVIGKNKFNPANIKNDQFLNSTTGAIVSDAAAAGWSWTGLIDLDEAGIAVGQYFAWDSDKLRTGASLFNSDGVTPARYLSMVKGTAQRLLGEKYFGSNLKSPAQPNWTWFIFEKGSLSTGYEPYKKVASKDSVEGLPTALVKLDDVAVTSNENKQKLNKFDEKNIPSTNKLNPTKATLKALLSTANGTLITGSNVTDQYNVTDFIETTALQFQEILNDFGGTSGARNMVVYGENKNFLAGIDLPGRPKKVQMPDNNLIRYVRYSLMGILWGQEPNKYTPEKMGVFDGENNVYESYLPGVDFRIANSVVTSKKDDSSIALIADVKNLISGTPTDPEITSLTYLISNGSLRISNGDDYVTVAIGNKRGYTGNDMLNFTSISCAGLTYSNGDDAAPIHAHNMTLGANHGHTSYLASITNHGLTNADIGTAFTQGANVLYLARVVSGTQLIFIGEMRGSANNPTFDVLSAGTILRNDVSFTVTSSEGRQLYPSIKNLKMQVFVDGKEIDPLVNATGAGEVIEIVESYEIKSLKSIIDYLKARVGSLDEPSFDGVGFIKIDNNYRFVEDLTCIVNVRPRQLEEMAFADIMGTQANLLGTLNDGSVEMYVPNSNPLNASVDLRKPKAITWTNSIPSTYITIANQPDPINPPSRIIEYKNNAGFSLGYLKNKGVGLNIPNFTAHTFEIRNNTGKLYPHPIESTKVGNMLQPNTVFNISLFRAFTDLRKSREGNRLSYFTVKDHNDFFVFIDYIGSMFDEINLNKPKLNGKRIEVVTSRNCELKSDIYNNGLIVNASYVEGETCFIELLIK
jgi:hypothetical protein